MCPTPDVRYQNIFDTAHLKQDLGRRSVRSGIVTLSSQAGKFVLTMASTMVLARMLGPAEFGLFAMVSLFTSFLAIFKDLGLAMATVRKPTLTHGEVTNLFWVNILISLALCVMIVLMAPAVAWFYNEPQLSLLTVSLSAGFMVSGFGIQHQALLRRQMRFAELSGIEIAGLLIGIVSGIIAAFFGVSYWALVVLQFVTISVNTLLCWYFCKWRPGLPFKNISVRNMVFFGGNITGSRMLNFFNLNLGNILIGKFLGATALGLFDKGNQLLLMPVNQFSMPVGSVAIPGLSSLQNEPERFRSYLRSAIFCLASMTLPVVVLMAMLAREMVLVFLGDKWLPVAAIFQLLAPAAALTIVSVATGWVYLSLGRADKQLKWGGVNFISNFFFLAVGLFWGVDGVAVAISAKAVFLAYPELRYCLKGTIVPMSDVIESLTFPLLYSLLAGGLVLIFKGIVPDQWGAFWTCVAVCVIYFVVYVGLWFCVTKGRILFFYNFRKIKEYCV